MPLMSTLLRGKSPRKRKWCISRFHFCRILAPLICKYIYIYIYAYIYAQTYVYTHTHICIHIYIYTHIYKYLWRAATTKAVSYLYWISCLFSCRISKILSYHSAGKKKRSRLPTHQSDIYSNHHISYSSVLSTCL